MGAWQGVTALLQVRLDVREPTYPRPEEQGVVCLRPGVEGRLAGVAMAGEQSMSRFSKAVSRTPLQVSLRGLIVVR